MYDLSSLNDYEFEQLCKDIMSKKLDQKLQTFARGRDGGIDISDNQLKSQIIIQAKHYPRSSVSSLMTSLGKEVRKVATKQPQQYFVCTSLELSREKKEKICEMFSGYMADISHIIDKGDIDGFLSREENQEIVQKHYKLWLCASNVLSLIQNTDVFVDCEELMGDIEEQRLFFVETQSYREAKEKLNNEQVVILVGAPGVGKTTLSKMLVMDCCSDGFSVRFTSTNEISAIKRVLTSDPKKKEVVLLDDFLGQHYLNLEESKPNELKSLLAFIKRNPAKRIILNSRITIFNEATIKYAEMRKLVDRYEKQKYVVDMDKEHSLDKAKILYNHLYFNQLPEDYFVALKENKAYFEFITHKNYNPRIIEFVTMKRNWQEVKPEEYVAYIRYQLNNPDEVWKNEFNHRMESIDRIFMNTLYSLTNNVIDSEILKEAFYSRLKDEEGIDTSKNQFEEVIKRLSESVLKRTEKGFSVLNPSINDYLSHSISSNEVEKLKIIETAVYAEQMLKMEDSFELVSEGLADKLSEVSLKVLNIFLTKNLEEMKSLAESPHLYYLETMLMATESPILQEDQKKRVDCAFKKLIYSSVHSYYECEQMLSKIFLSHEFYDFYELENYYSEDLGEIIEYFEASTLEEFYDEYRVRVFENLGNEQREKLIIIFIGKFKEQLEYELKESIESDLVDLVESFFEDYVSGENIEDAELEMYRELEEYIDEIISERWDNRIKPLSKFYPELLLQNLEVPFSANDFNIAKAEKAFARRVVSDYKPDYDVENMIREIENMFER